MALLGIDLGTTNSLAAVWNQGKSVLIPNSFGEFLTPSAVSIVEDGAVVIGKQARERLASHPDMTVKSFKRFMGTDKIFSLGAQSLGSVDLSALLLRQLREDAQRFLGEAVEEAVISVPAYFNDHQRAATKQAGELAGFRVERLINEPSAASLYYRVNGEDSGNDEDQDFLVVDFGGGTLDVSVVSCFDNIVEISAVSGDNRLGGDDFDRAMMEFFCRENSLEGKLSPREQAHLLRTMESAKKALTQQEQVQMIFEKEGSQFSLIWDRGLLRVVCQPLLERMGKAIRHVMADGGIPIATIILVGGTSKMPLIRKYLHEITGITPVAACNPDETVALGVGACAGIKARDGSIRESLLTDVCPFSLGIGTNNPAKASEAIMCPIIERNSTLPCSRRKNFCTVSDLQTEIKIDIYQGEAMYCSDNLFLGVIHIPVPPAPAGAESVDVVFSYDINGILEAQVTNSQKKTIRRLIVSNSACLGEDELRERLAVLNALKIQPADREENNSLLERARLLFQELSGPSREILTAYVDAFNKALTSEKIRVVRNSRLALEEILDRLEQREESALDLFCVPDGENSFDVISDDDEPVEEDEALS